MMKHYRLLFVSLCKPDRPEGIFCSNHMIAWGLWEAFSLMPHVVLDYQDSDSPLTAQGPWDFVLIHAYFGSPIYEALSTIHQRTRQVLLVQKISHDSPHIDHHFTFLTPHVARATHIGIPSLKSLLAATIRPKHPGSVLLDHAWLPYAGTDFNWCPRLRQWLHDRMAAQLIRSPDSYAAQRCAQLLRSGCTSEEHLPPGWQAIAETGYPQYLEATAHFQNFIVTHPGSYEHSIIDMAARGIRVLVPQIDGKPFIHPELVEALRLATFGSETDLDDLLNATPHQATLLDDGQPYHDLAEIAAQIDAYCQEAMP